jgi:hypothetical protein
MRTFTGTLNLGKSTLCAILISEDPQATAAPAEPSTAGQGQAREPVEVIWHAGGRDDAGNDNQAASTGADRRLPWQHVGSPAERHQGCADGPADTCSQSVIRTCLIHTCLCWQPHVPALFYRGLQWMRHASAVSTQVVTCTV